MFEASAISPAPYPGLRPFKREEFDIFFGRDRHVDAMVDKLEANRFLCVTGPSGCGKSSLARTGLFNALEAGFLEGYGSDWVFCDFRPGDVPIKRLAGALAHAILTGDSSSEIDPALTDDKAELAAFFRNQIASVSSDLNPATENAVALGGRPIVILVDQFEEIFRYAQADPHAAARFVDVLLKTARARKDIFVVITIRTDELAKCARYEGLTAAINDSQFLTPTLDRFQMQEAIEGPITLFGGQIDTNLTIWLLNALEEELDKLPIMQHALKLLYAHKRDKIGAGDVVITKSDFVEVFDLTEAQITSHGEGRSILNLSLSNCLDRLFKDLPEETRGPARRMFTALTNIESQRRDIRNPMRLDELAKTANTTLERARDVVKRFSAGDEAYLQPPGDVDLKPTTIIDVTHECVLRLWVRLRGKWVAGEQSNAENIRLLARMARDRDSAERFRFIDKLTGAGLLKGHVLERYSRWWNMLQPNATWAARYLDRISWGEATAEEKFAQVEAFLNKSRRVSWQLRTLTLACAAMIIGGSIYAVREVQISRQHAARTTVWETYKNLRPSGHADDPLGVVENALQYIGLSGEFTLQEKDRKSALDNLRLALSFSYEVQRFTTGPLQGQKLQAARFADQGRSVVGLGADPVLSVWQLDDPEAAPRTLDLAPFVTLPEVERVGRSLDVHRSGKLAAVGMRHGGVLLVDLDTFEVRELLTGQGSVLDLTFSADGQMLAASSLDGVARIWNRSGGGAGLDGWELAHEVRYPAQDTGGVNGIWSVDLSDDNVMLATGMRDGRVCAHNLTLNQTACSRLGVHAPGQAVKAVAFRPGSRVLVSGGNDDRAVIWEPLVSTISRETIQLQPAGPVIWHDSDVWDIAFSRDGDLMASIAWDGSIRIFEAGSWRPVRSTSGHTAPPRTISFDPSGNYLVSAATDRTARIWSPYASLAEDVRYSARLPRYNDLTYRNVASLAFAPEAAFIAFTDGSRVYVKPPQGPAEGLPAPRLDSDAFAEPRQLTDQDAIATYKDVMVTGSGAVLASGNLGALHVWHPSEGGWNGTEMRFRGLPPNASPRINDIAAQRGGDLLAFALRLRQGEYAIAVCPAPAPGTNLCDVTVPGGALINVNRTNLPSDAGLKACRENRFLLSAIAISDDGRWVAAGTSDCVAQVFDLGAQTPEPIELVGHVGSIAGLGFDADGKRLVTASSDWFGSVWDIDTRARIELDREHRSRLTDAVFAPSGKMAATVSLDEKLILWDALTGEPRVHLPGHRSNILVVDAARRPDGTMLIATGTSDGEVSVYPHFDDGTDLRDYAQTTLARVLGPDVLDDETSD